MISTSSVGGVRFGQNMSQTLANATLSLSNTFLMFWFEALYLSEMVNNVTISLDLTGNPLLLSFVIVIVIVDCFRTIVI